MLKLFLILLFLVFKTCLSFSNDFSFALYKNLMKDHDQEQKNIFFSPYSITTAIEVAYEGARGITADEFIEVFNFNRDNHVRRAENKKFLELLNEPKNDYTFLTANALWVEQSFNILPTYQTVAQKWYKATIKKVDFKHAPQKVETIINTWVQQQTHGMIPTILTPNSLNELTRLVITNAVYFKGSWSSPFDAQQTKEEDFFVNEKITKKISMMHTTQEYAYAENDSLQMIELNYTGKNLSMLIILPKEKKLAEIENMLTVENFESWKLDLVKKKVQVSIPRIKIESSYDLVETFKTMGIKKAFNPSKKLGADFSGIDGKRDLYIALINHKAALEVNEEGTTAAASTAVVIMMKSMMPRPTPIFHADHPFIIMIQEKTTGKILFMGRIVNPI